jgi:hypothetical protein
MMKICQDIRGNRTHGLSNNRDTKAFIGFSSKLTCREIFRR